MNVLKTSGVMAGTVSAEDLPLINAQALQNLDAESVYVFHLHACNDAVDRDFERFPLESLQKMAPLFVGKPVIMDHRWSAKDQIARIYDAKVAESDGMHVLRLSCYMLRNDSTADTIAAIAGGILREVSVGLAVSTIRCGICGENARKCDHYRGESYDGIVCVYELCDPVDAYEASFVAVPSQRDAGVAKAHDQKTGWTPADIAAEKARINREKERTKYYESIC